MIGEVVLSGPNRRSLAFCRFLRFSRGCSNYIILGRNGQVINFGDLQDQIIQNVIFQILLLVFEGKIKNIGYFFASW